MEIRLFTQDEIDELNLNPAVLKVNEHFLHLTAEFKEWFYQEFQRGRMAKDILRAAGFDLGILTANRVRSIRAHVLKWKSEQTQNLIKFRSDYTLPSVYELATAREQIARLEHDLKRTKQELDFVKKIIKAGREE